MPKHRPRFDDLPGETSLFLSDYGTGITPAHLGNEIKKLMRHCGARKAQEFIRIRSLK